MVEEYNDLIVGILFILTSFIFLSRNRKNLYNKGWDWFFFAFFHGIDEIADGMNEILNPSEFYYFILLKLELIAFFLSGTFLLIGTLIRFNAIKSSDIFLIGFLIQMPLLLFFASMPKSIILVISSWKVFIVFTEVNVTTIMFGVVPVIPLVVLYLVKSIQLLQKPKVKGFHNLRGASFHLIIACMMIIYAISEMYASNYSILLYIEVFSFSVILLTPIEFNFGSEDNIQLFLMYDINGSSLLNIRFNTGLTEEVLHLVTNFMSAIHKLIREALELGSLDRIDTEKGILLTKHRDNFIYSVLVKDANIAILSRFNSLVDVLNHSFKFPDGIIVMPSETIREMEKVVITRLNV